MNPEQQEQRIADLEKRLKLQEESSVQQSLFAAAVISILANMGDQTLTKDHMMLDSMVKAQANTERMFGMFATLLPTEEIRQNFHIMLNHSTVTRDQIEAVLEQMKNQPKPSDILKKIGQKNQPPPSPPA